MTKTIGFTLMWAGFIAYVFLALKGHDLAALGAGLMTLFLTLPDYDE